MKNNRSGLSKRIAKGIGLLLLAVILAGMAGWGVLALLYFDHENQTLRQVLAAAFGFAALVALIGLALPRWRWRACAGFLVMFAVLLSRWFAIEPSNDRQWAPEVAVLPYATVDGDNVTVHNIRNFDYRTETDFTPAYYDKTFDLNQLDSVDLLTSYWMGPDIAHLFLSFGFAGKDYLSISIEARKESTEGYSSIAGFFRQFELFYVVADERDVVRLRTNYRRDPPEDVYLYPVVGAPQQNARRLFLEYMEKINGLKQHPQFYNSLTTNCANTLWQNTRVNPGHLPFSSEILTGGHVPEYLYTAGRVDTSVPFAQLRERSHINARAQAADKALDFSQRIRQPAAPAMAP